MTQPAAATPLPTDMLARRARLPLKPAAVMLTGEHVRLAPLDLARDVERLHALSNGQPATLGDRTLSAYDADALIWRYMFAGPFSDPVALGVWLRAQVEAPNGRCLSVTDVATDTPVGVVNYVNNYPEHLKVELGHIWYSPLVQRTAANTEAAYLLLRHAFALGYRRVEWKCDARNERSRQAALRLGFRFEGLQEAHFIVKDRNRDTAWFRLLDHEWPAAQAHLQSILARAQ